MKLAAVGVDVAKRVFRLHWVEAETISWGRRSL
ncbi:hypothetical protein LMG9964_06620 [Paraburkholderia phenoliruptrix]|uniref:IS110 family transposase n=1 Tax=Paraburkholderia phenoliruptrix TaxID=252970 RepID=A0A6J5KF66_9BURK|nr:hypothetical protein LMG9964_06620 [Paraburkholderia phenoliruptrix]